MRVAIVSDIHGNRRAFDAVLADLRAVAPDLVLHGGDLAYGGAHPAYIIDQIRSLGWPGVRGNTDEMLWAPESLTQFAARQPKLGPLLSRIQDCIPPTLASIGQERLRWLEALPYQHSGDGFCLVHASLNDCWRGPMPEATDDELRTTYAPLRAPVVAYGHIHRPYIRRLRDMTVVNTGSVSQSYDGDRRASYLLMDGSDLTIRRVEYYVEAEANDLRASGLPHADWLARILLAGKYSLPTSRAFRHRRSASHAAHPFFCRGDCSHYRLYGAEESSNITLWSREEKRQVNCFAAARPAMRVGGQGPWGCTN